jgi:hypothetical protein
MFLVCFKYVLTVLVTGKGMVIRNPRDIQRDVVKELGEFIRISRKGLPLLATGPLDGKKETKAQTKMREDFEDKLKRRNEDHVSMFLQSLDNPALLAEEASDHEEKDDIDEEEAEHIEKQLMALLEEDDASSNDGSESSVNYDVEDTTNQEQLEKNNQALRTEQV